MKKFTSAIGLFLIALLFIGCSNDTNDDNIDTELMEQVQGKWRLTEFQTDTDPISTPIANGYTMELKSDGTFTSDEVDGYTGGTYTVIKNPGKNLQLMFTKQWSAKLYYKYINSVTADHMYVQASTAEPLSDEFGYFESYTLTRIP